MEESFIDLINRHNQISDKKDNIIRELMIKRDELKSKLDTFENKVGEQADEIVKLRLEKDNLTMTIEGMKEEDQKFRSKISALCSKQKRGIENLKAEIEVFKKETKIPTYCSNCEIERDVDVTNAKSEVLIPSNPHIKYVKKYTFIPNLHNQ